MLRDCATNMKSMLVIHGGGPKGEPYQDRRQQQEDTKPVQLQEPGIRGRNPSQGFQVNFLEHSTRKSVLSANHRSKPKQNNQFSDKSKIHPKLSTPSDLKSPIIIASNKFQPNQNIDRSKTYQSN
jgi:hypothetical protein